MGCSRKDQKEVQDDRKVSSGQGSGQRLIKPEGKDRRLEEKIYAKN